MIRTELCRTCGGSGCRVSTQTKCNACLGAGYQTWKLVEPVEDLLVSYKNMNQNQSEPKPNSPDPNQTSLIPEYEHHENELQIRVLESKYPETVKWEDTHYSLRTQR